MRRWRLWCALLIVFASAAALSGCYYDPYTGYYYSYPFYPYPYPYRPPYPYPPPPPTNPATGTPPAPNAPIQQAPLPAPH
jgi:hypothetical protein